MEVLHDRLKGVRDETGTHRLGSGRVGDVVFSGGQRQGRLIELHEHREYRYNTAAFGLVYLITEKCFRAKR